MLPLSRLHHRPWISNAYGSVTCKFSKSSGPVRYTPRIVKQPKSPSTRERPKPHRHDIEETNKNVPPMPLCAPRFHYPRLAGSMHLNCDLIKQDRETGAESGLHPDDENDSSPASAKSPQHVFESRASGASGSKSSYTNSSKVFEACTSMQDMPMISSDQFDSFHRCSRYQGEARAINGILSEEEWNRTTTFDRKHAAKWSQKVPRQSHESPARSFTKTQQTFGIEAINNLDCAMEKAQATEKKRFHSIESNVEGTSRPQAAKSIQSKRSESREVDFQEGQWLPHKDVEISHSKLQNSKQRGWESFSNSQAAATVECSLSIDDNNDFRDGSNDNKCLILGQESFNENDDGAIINFKDSVLNSTAAQEHAKNQAIRYLAMRPYTAYQLKKKLESRNIMSELADYALATVQKCGLQSDLAYAETFSRARFNHGSWGPQRIKLGLKQRGVSDEIIQAAIASIFCEEEKHSVQDGRVKNDAESNSTKMSRAAMDHLLVQATKQWNRGRNATNETKIRRMVSWLQYRGFNYKVIQTVLKHVRQGIHIEDE